MSELSKSTWEPLWPPQGVFLPSKTPPQSPQNHILTSYGARLDLIFPLCKLLTCMYHDNSTGMYYDHSTGMYYDQITCTFRRRKVGGIC